MRLFSNKWRLSAIKVNFNDWSIAGQRGFVKANDSDSGVGQLAVREPGPFPADPSVHTQGEPDSVFWSLISLSASGAARGSNLRAIFTKPP